MGKCVSKTSKTINNTKLILEIIGTHWERHYKFESGNETVLNNLKIELIIHVDNKLSTSQNVVQFLWLVVYTLILNLYIIEVKNS